MITLVYQDRSGGGGRSGVGSKRCKCNYGGFGYQTSYVVCYVSQVGVKNSSSPASCQQLTSKKKITNKNEYNSSLFDHRSAFIKEDFMNGNNKSCLKYRFFKYFFLYAFKTA